MRSPCGAGAVASSGDVRAQVRPSPRPPATAPPRPPRAPRYDRDHARAHARCHCCCYCCCCCSPAGAADSTPAAAAAAASAAAFGSSGLSCEHRRRWRCVESRSARGQQQHIALFHFASLRGRPRPRFCNRPVGPIKAVRYLRFVRQHFGRRGPGRPVLAPRRVRCPAGSAPAALPLDALADAAEAAAPPRGRRLWQWWRGGSGGRSKLIAARPTERVRARSVTRRPRRPLPLRRTLRGRGVRACCARIGVGRTQGRLRFGCFRASPFAWLSPMTAPAATSCCAGTQLCGRPTSGRHSRTW